jgi:hypothetical protein
MDSHMNTRQRLVAGILGIALTLTAFLVFVEEQLDSSDAPAGVSPSAGEVDAPQPAPHPASASPRGPGAAAVQAALAALDTVPVTPTTRIPGYDRELFGDAWEDVDGNGCDTRNDILARDLVITSTDGACRILTGILVDAYTGKTIDFVRGEVTSQAVQIDHIVPLGGAWKSGAYAWSTTQREAFANDPANLRAVDGSANSSKGDRGPARWMPGNVGGEAFDCSYASAYVDVLARYDLTAPAEDLVSLRRTLALCA